MSSNDKKYSAKRIQSQMADFVRNNVDLIAEYDSTEGVLPFDNCRYDVIEKIKSIQKQYRGYDFRTIMKNALIQSIESQQSIIETLHEFEIQLLTDASEFNSIQTYFREVGDLYKKYEKDTDFEYTPENREKLLELNTKMVVSVAKRYQGLGLSLQELISAGNYGLCIAWDKYKPERSKLKDNMIEAIESIQSDSFDLQALTTTLSDLISYGNIKQKFDESFNDLNKIYTKSEVLRWINQNIKNAKFSSIAMSWIKAYILIEIDNASRLVKKPKTEIYKDKLATGAYQKENLMDISSAGLSNTSSGSGTINEPVEIKVSPDFVGYNGSTIGNSQALTDDTTPDLDVTEAYDAYKEGLSKLLDGVGTRDRSVLLKKYGIGLPRPMSPQEISEIEQLSIARISQICLNVLAQMKENAIKYNIDESILFDAVSKFR